MNITFELVALEHALDHLSQINAVLTDPFSQHIQRQLETGQLKMLAVHQDQRLIACLVIRLRKAIDLVYQNGEGIPLSLYNVIKDAYLRQHGPDLKYTDSYRQDMAIDISALSKYEIMDVNTDKIYHLLRLPGGLTVDAIYRLEVNDPYASFSGRLPDNLTVQGDLSIGPVSPLNSVELPRGLTVSRYMAVSRPVTRIGENTRAALTQYTTEIYVHRKLVIEPNVFLRNVRFTTVYPTVFEGEINTDAVIKISNQDLLSNVSVNGSLSIEPKDTIKDEKSNIKDIRASDTIEIKQYYNKIIDGIECKTLVLTECSRIKLQNLRIENILVNFGKIIHPEIELPDNLTILGDLTFSANKLESPDQSGIKIGRNTTIMGNARLFSNMTVPESFCCLGKISI